MVATLYPLMAGVGAPPRVDTSAMATYLSSALGLVRDSSSVLALRNGTTAQRFQVSGTFTDASNYERGAIYFSSGKLTIGYEAAGTGTAARNIEFVTNSQTFSFGSGGVLNTPSLGVTGTAAPPDGISKPATGEVSLWGRSLRTLQIFSAASAVNWVAMANSPTGIGVGFSAAQGSSDTNVPFSITSKGAAGIFFFTGGSSFLEQFRVLHTASAVNRLQVTGGAAGSSVVLSADGSDAAIGVKVSPKGTAPFMVTIANVQDFADDTAAAAGSIPIGGFYRTASAVKIRVS